MGRRTRPFWVETKPPGRGIAGTTSPRGNLLSSSRWIAWISATGLAGCVTVPQFQGLESSVEDLKARDESAGGSHIAELRQEVEMLREQIAAIRGQLEEARHLAEDALSEVDAARRSRVAREPDPGRAGEIPLIPRTSGSPGNELERGVPSEETSAEIREYEAAFRLYGAGNCRTAVSRFRAFIQAYPQSNYADNALFWMAECHQKLGDPMLAALTFERVHRQYPNGNKVPDALYRQAVALLAIGNRNGERAAHESAAREVLQRLLDEYPRWERVDEVRRMLGKLSS